MYLHIDERSSFHCCCRRCQEPRRLDCHSCRQSYYSVGFLSSRTSPFCRWPAERAHVETYCRRTTPTVRDNSVSATFRGRKQDDMPPEAYCRLSTRPLQSIRRDSLQARAYTNALFERRGREKPPRLMLLFDLIFFSSRFPRSSCSSSSSEKRVRLSARVIRARARYSSH